MACPAPITAGSSQIRRHWVFGLAAFYLRRKLLRQKNPFLASFKITHRCNLTCRGCPFHQRALDNNAHMTRQAAVDCLQQLQRKGCRIVIFEGGEPFLWKDGGYTFGDLVAEAKRRFLRVGVTTNGTFSLDVPADVIWVSLDGLKPTHDRLRCNSFDRAWHNLASAIHRNVLVHITLNSQNWSELEALIAMLPVLPAVRGITLQLFYPYNQGEESLALTPRQRAAALKKAVELKKAGYPILNSSRRLGAMIENTWTCHDDILINVDPDGTIVQGCYVKNRGHIQCSHCGFTPVAEASGAMDLLPGSLLAGWRIFFSHR